MEEEEHKVGFVKLTGAARQKNREQLELLCQS